MSSFTWESLCCCAGLLMSVALWIILYNSVIARVLIITFHLRHRGKRQHEAPRFLTINTANEQLLEIWAKSWRIWWGSQLLHSLQDQVIYKFIFFVYGRHTVPTFILYSRKLLRTVFYMRLYRSQILNCVCHIMQAPSVIFLSPNTLSRDTRRPQMREYTLSFTNQLICILHGW